MAIRWTTEQIIALAPDGQVAQAARGLAQPARWQNVGQDDQVIWGEHLGSGETPYQVAVEPAELAFKCTCPSRKRPCKHLLGLLLLAEAAPGHVRAAELPEWVQQWRASRASDAKRRAAREEKPAGTVADARAQARRSARRLRRVQEGAATLTTWIEDILQRGIGALPGEPASFWATQAARLVDAQAPGLARRVRELALLPASGEGWPARMLERLARLYLLIEAFRRIEELPEGLQEEVRSQVGWTQEQDALRQQAGEPGRWLVMGQRSTEAERLRVQRTWLWQAEGKRAALVLDFALPGQPFENILIPGTCLEAELAFWPSSFPLRALVKAQRDSHPLGSVAGYVSLREALSAYGAALAGNPWLERFLMPLEQVVPYREGMGWAIRDEQDAVLPLALPPGEGYRLLALSGGCPITLAGEWDGERLAVLSVWVEGGLVPIGDGR